MSVQTTHPYPVRVEAQLETPSRWLWLVKWLLIVPHAIVLCFLWVAFALLTIVAFFGILFTGRYPRSIFDFNVGVLRWSWRVGYYAYSALGTDHYPPFTLAEVADYPAHLDIAYPDHLSRGLVLVKWWLLAIPHYIIVGVFVGGTWFAAQSMPRIGGLIGILVLISAVALAVTGTYPKPLYDLVLGLDRWVLRVAAYAGLMTDEYPPFRLDVGGPEPAGSISLAPPPATAPAGTAPWTAGRIVALVIGALLTLISFGPLAAGAGGAVFDLTQRDADGYLHTGMHTFTTTGYALTSQGVAVRFEEPSLRFARGLLGKARVTVRSANTDKAVFAGIAAEQDVNAYLGGVEHAQVTDVNRTSRVRTIAGGAPTGIPSTQSIWTTRTTGAGTQTLAIPIRAGSWTLVVMNADASRGVTAAIDVGATAPALGWMSAVALAIGLVVLAGGIALMVASIARR